MRLKRKLQIRDYINIVAILILIGLLVLIGRAYLDTFGEMNSGDLLSSAENLRDYILSFGKAGLLVMISLHALHVVITIIPSGIIQFAGGMIYGMGFGMISGLVGIPIGTAVSFYLSRFFGRRLVTLLVSKKNIDKLEGLISSNTSAIVLLMIFILPLPKDILAYFVGLTNMKASKFFLISAVGRLPGMLMATYLGAHIFDRNYVLIVSVVVICSIFTLLVFIFNNRILILVKKRAGYFK